MKKILMLLLVLGGVAGGGYAGALLKPPPTEDGREAGPAEAEGGGEPGTDGAEGGSGGDHGAAPAGVRDYVEIGRQMIIPVVEGDETRALMMFELALDVPLEMRDAVYAREPRIRDAFLRELFAMSHTGAFLDTFTDDLIVAELRRKLLAAARQELGPEVSDVLILDIMRQEM